MNVIMYELLKLVGGAENAGPKMQDRKMWTNDVNFEGPKCSTGKCGTENAGPESVGPKNAGCKMQDRKIRD